MPSMADFAPLLAAKGIDLPTPMQYGGQALTLGNMALGNQMQQLQLQKMQDMISAVSNPAYLQAVSQMFGGGGGGMGGPGTGAGAPDLSFLSGNKAAPELLQNLFGMAEKSSQIGKNYAEAGKMGSETLNMGLTRLLNSAAGTPRDQVTPELASFWYHQLGMMGFDPRQIGAGNAGTPADFRDALVNQLQDPQTRQKLVNEATENWAKQAGVMQKQAELGKGEAIKGDFGYDVFHPTTPPNLPAPPGALGQQWGAQSPPFQGVPAGATVKLTGPASASDVQTLLSAAAQEGGQAPPQGVAPPQQSRGTGGQVFYSPQQKQDIEIGAKEIEDLRTKNSAATQVMGMIQDLRNLDHQGIYSGGIQGTDFFRKIANIVAALPNHGGLSPEQLQKLGNSQAWDADTRNLVALAVKQFAGSRVAARELSYFQGSKPDDLMTDAGRELTYRMVYTLADRTHQDYMQADKYAHTKGNYGLAGYTPQFTDTKMPDIQVGGVPNPTTHKGWVWTDDKGTKHTSDGMQWWPPIK